MQWLLTTSEPNATVPETLLAEWEARMQPLTTQAYDQARTQFLEQFQLLSHLMLPTADVNVDEEDIRAVLRQAHSLRIGSGRASGPERAARATHKALEHARQHLLGPLPSKAAQAALLRITSRRGAELEAVRSWR